MDELRRQLSQSESAPTPAALSPSAPKNTPSTESKKRGSETKQDARATKQQRVTAGAPAPSAAITLAPAANFMSPEKLPMAAGTAGPVAPANNFMVPTARAPVASAAGAAVVPSSAGKGKANNKTPAKTPRTKQREEKAEEEEDDSNFLFSAVNTVLKVGSPNAMPTPSKPVYKPAESTRAKITPFDISNIPTSLNPPPVTNAEVVPAGAAADGKNGRFRALSFAPLPSDFPFVDAAEVMQILSTSGTDHATKGATGGQKPPKTTATQLAAPGTNSDIVKKIEARNLGTLQWGGLVGKTQSHTRFTADYNWQLDELWVRARPYGEWSRSKPMILAIDCEFCASIDPVTGVKDGSTLIRFSVVNGLNSNEVLIDEYVKPRFPVSEMRTNIHGITEEDLKDVQYTLRDAQAALLEMCSDRTIIVGHSVHNDLKSLHFYHTTVIDTAYLFSVENEPGANPSMRDVSQHALQMPMPEIHNSALDARVASLAAAFLLVFPDGSTACPRTSIIAAHHSLLVHRLPENCSDEAVFKMFVKYTNILPCDIQGLPGKGDADAATESSSSSGLRDKVNALFSTIGHAELAFDSIPGPNRPDKAGRAQKRVYYKYQGNKGGYICIRKNVGGTAPAL